PEREPAHLPREVEEAPPPKPTPAPEGAGAKPPVDQKPAPEPDKKPVVEDKSPAKPSTAGPTPVQPPSDKRVDVGRYVYAGNRPGVLLRAPRDAATAWQRVVPEGAVSTAEYLVSLPGYRSELRLGSGVRLQLWGNVPEFSPIPVLESAATLHAN